MSRLLQAADRVRVWANGAPRATAHCLLACLAGALLGGCAAGAGHGMRTRTPTAGSGHAFSRGTLDPVFTPVQRLIARGATIFIADGCAACHSIGEGESTGPSFAGLNETTVKLANGRRVPVDERFLREALLDPQSHRVQGYRLAPMLGVVRRLHLRAHPTDVAALAAFLESIGSRGG
jgi:mono/diheme cytochrome c family protein